MARAASFENSSVVFKDDGSSSSARSLSSDRGGFSEKNFNSDDHFDRRFLFMGMKANSKGKESPQKQSSLDQKKGRTMNPLIQFKKIPILPLIAVALVIWVVPTAVQANEVTHWNQIATDTLAAFPPAAGGAPNALQINMGMTQGAVYHAVNAIEPRHRPYLLATRFNANASKEAAAATAAYSVLSNIVSTVPPGIPFPNRAMLQASLDAAYAASLAGIPDGPPKTQGIAAGTAAANAMLAARQNDGRFGPSPVGPNCDPGHWQPLLNPDGTPILDPTPWVGGVLPFLMQSSSQFRTDGPNALTSTAYAEDFNEVKALGSINSTSRTPEQTHIAIFWQGAPPPLAWNRVARHLIDQYAVDIGDSALLFAMLNLSAADDSCC